MSSPIPHQLGLALHRVIGNCTDGQQPDLREMRRLLDAGAHPGVIDEYGMTPLYIAAEANYIAAASMLADAHAAIDAETANRYTPLRIAASKGHIDIVRMLVAKGADIHNDMYTCSILMEACLYGQTEVAKFLLAHGADPLRPDHAGRTAHSMCRKKYPETAKMIKEHMRQARFDSSPELRDRIFNRIAHRALAASKDPTITMALKMKPRK